MTAVAPDQPLCGQKRRGGTIEEEHSTTATPQHPWKKAKRSRQSQQDTNTAYWDSLSKLWLTRCALDELNRRNRQRASPVRTASARRQDLEGEPGQLKRFARYGGPDLRDLRGVSLAQEMSISLLISSLQYPEPSIPNSTVYVMLSNQSSSRTQSKSRDTLGDSTAKTITSKTKKTSLYNPNFEQNLIDNSIYPDDYNFPDGRDPPRLNNENEILYRLGQPRPSLSPSRFTEKVFRSFKQHNSRALNKDAIIADVFPVIHGTAPILSSKNLVFGNLEQLTYGNFVDAKPDFYDGVRSVQIDLRIREELGSYIIPATQGQAPALPNFFTEVKGPDGSGAVAKRQACFDGVLGARGIHKLRLFEADDSETVYNNDAHTITSTYHSATGTLQIYTIHQTQPIDPGNPPEYYISQLRSFAMTDTAERFREGAGAFRNARDWAKTQQDELIAVANSRVLGIHKETSILESSAYSMSQSIIETVVLESETSADELSQDIGQGSSFSHKRLKREPEKRSSNPNLKARLKKSYSGADIRSRSRGRLSQRR